MASLLPFDNVSIDIPRKEILVALEQPTIKRKEFFKYRKLDSDIEHAIYKLQHARSVLNRVLIKSYEYEL